MEGSSSSFLLLITGTNLALFRFQDLFTSFLRSWYLAIFLISTLFRPKSLETDTSISNAVSSCLYPSAISGHDALFSMFILNRTIRSHVIVTSLFTIIAFGLCFHEFSVTGILKFLQMWQWTTLHILLCLCVYSGSGMSCLHPDRRWLMLSVSTLQNLHLYN